MVLHRVFAAALIAGVAGTVASPASGQNYDFVKIADDSGGAISTIVSSGPVFIAPFGNFASGSPAIYAGGTVAFYGELNGGVSGIFTSDGGPVTTIADANGPFSGFGVGTSINDAGTVAFAASLDAGGAGIFTGDGGPVATIADSSGLFATFVFVHGNQELI